MTIPITPEQLAEAKARTERHRQAYPNFGKITPSKLAVALNPDSGYDLLTPQYWDCECETGYIHPYAENVCPRCSAIADEWPDSRVSEIADAGLPLVISPTALAQMSEINIADLPEALR